MKYIIYDSDVSYFSFIMASFYKGKRLQVTSFGRNRSAIIKALIGASRLFYWDYLSFIIFLFGVIVLLFHSVGSPLLV